jgi:hypothetical protein
MSDDERLPAIAEKAPPPVKLARDHASRGPREVLYVDRSGRGITPARAHAPQAIALAASVALTSVGFFSWWFPFVIAAILGWHVWQLRHALRGAALMLHHRFDEAERELSALARSPVVHPAYRSNARAALAGIEARRGNHAPALEWATRATRFAWPAAQRAFARMVRVSALINVDRVNEARVYFDRHLRTVRSGDVMRHAHWTAGLYLALAEGRHTLDADELHRRAREALGVTAGRSLLALLAWAHHENGDEEQAWHLLREALAREDVEVTARSRPRLHAWMEAHRAEALAAAPADDEVAARIAEHEAEP